MDNNSEVKTENRKRKTKILIAIVLAYTILISGITIAIDRSIIKHQVEKSFNDAFCR